MFSITKAFVAGISVYVLTKKRVDRIKNALYFRSDQRSVNVNSDLSLDNT